MYIKNSNGPKTEPCGTPQLFINSSEDCSLKDTNCLQLITYD